MTTKRRTGSSLKEGEFTNKDFQINNNKIPLNIKMDLIINFIGVSLLIFIFIFIPIEILLGHLRIFEIPLLGLFGVIILFGFLFLMMIDMLRENLADVHFLKEHIYLNIIDLEKILEKTNENLFNAFSLRSIKIHSKVGKGILGLMVIITVALFLSIGKTEERNWYMTEISWFLVGLFFILIMIIYIFFIRNESKARYLHESVLIHKIIVHKKRQIDLK